MVRRDVHPLISRLGVGAVETCRELEPLIVHFSSKFSREGIEASNAVGFHFLMGGQHLHAV